MAASARSLAAVTPPCPPREWIRISYMAVHPEPELRTHAPFPHEPGNVIKCDFLPPDTGDYAEYIFFGLGHDGCRKDAPVPEGIVAVDHDHLFSDQVQFRERAEPAQTHRTGFYALAAELVNCD